MAWRTLALALTAGVVAAVCGCGPAKLKRELAVRLGDQPSQVWAFDPQPVDQTFTLELTTDNPVDVFVLVGVDETVATGMGTDELTQKAVASKRGVTGETLTAKIPAKQPAAVVVRFAEKRQPATGKIKVSN